MTNPIDDQDECDDREEECLRCGGEGRITTADYESYFGADFKPCPMCYGDPCTEQPPTS